jgi:hypothetical protein
MDLNFLLNTPVEELEKLSSTVLSASLLSLIECILVIKKNGYDTLSDEELDKEEEGIKKHRKYLDKCHSTFVWNNEDTPEGLSTEIYETEQCQEAIQFEKERRLLQKQIKEQS